MYGYQPDFTILASSYSNIPTVDECLDWLKEARTDAEAVLQQSKEKMARDGKLPQEFKIEDKV